MNKTGHHPMITILIFLLIEVVLIAIPVLRGWGWVAIISPLFATVLLTRISGIPMLERSAD